MRSSMAADADQNSSLVKRDGEFPASAMVRRRNVETLSGRWRAASHQALARATLSSIKPTWRSES